MADGASCNIRAIRNTGVIYKIIAWLTKVARGAIEVHVDRTRAKKISIIRRIYSVIEALEACTIRDVIVSRTA